MKKTKMMSVFLMLVMVLGTIGAVAAIGDNNVGKETNPLPAVFTKGVDQTNVQVGDVVTFTVMVSNPNAAGKHNGYEKVRISDVVPAGLEVIGVTGATNVGNSIEANIGKLGPGKSATITITAKVLAEGKYVNTANLCYVKQELVKASWVEHKTEYGPKQTFGSEQEQTSLKDVRCFMDKNPTYQFGEPKCNLIFGKEQTSRDYLLQCKAQDARDELAAEHPDWIVSQVCKKDNKCIDTYYFTYKKVCGKYYTVCYQVPHDVCIFHKAEYRCCKMCAEASADPVVATAVPVPPTPPIVIKETKVVKEEQEPATIPMEKTGAVPIAGLLGILSVLGGLAYGKIRR